MSGTVNISNRFALLSTPKGGVPKQQPPPKAADDKKPGQEQKRNDRDSSQSRNQNQSPADNRRRNTRGDGEKSGRGGRGGSNQRGPRPTTEGKDTRPPRDEAGRQKRKFDRRSGTGRNPNEEKRGNHGVANWGTAEDALVGQTDAEKSLAEEATVDAAATGEEQAPEAPTFSLAEYEKQKQENQVKLDLPAPRVVEEDEDLKKKFTKLEKRQDEKPAKKKESKDNKDKDNKDKSKKQVVPLAQVLDVKPPPRGDSDRFSSRGGKGKYSNSNSNSHSQGAQQKGAQSRFTYDEGAFPALH